MCEITVDNFRDTLPAIKESLQKAKFIALDLEFSALNPVQRPQLFDNNRERYAKFRANLANVVPLQVGLTAFHFDSHTNSYCGDVFTFYVCPPAFARINKNILFQASTTRFLCSHKFDFNKFAYLGIPYLTRDEESSVRAAFQGGDFMEENCEFRCELYEAIRRYVPVVQIWSNFCGIGDFLEIPDAKKYRRVYEVWYFLHKHFRSRFKGVWTYEQNGCFFVKKVAESERNRLMETCNLNESILDDLKGFRHVFELLTSLRKTLVGHNLFQDLLILINTFETTLPTSYLEFKRLVHGLFPHVFDTKTIYYELRQSIPNNKCPVDTSLSHLFHYFKDGLGRHLVVDKSAIECSVEANEAGSFHQAGWDSFCTGYIFLRMGYFNLAKDASTKRSFVCSEIINGLAQYKNCVNVIRGAASHLRLDGEDPSSQRPPWLIVSSMKRQPLDMHHLISELSSYGFVDIKKINFRDDRVLVAVDNFRAAKEISRNFKGHKEFQVMQYSFLKHSSLGRAAILGAVTLSGTVLLWLTHSVVKK